MENGVFVPSLSHTAENSMGVDSTVSHMFSSSLDLLEECKQSFITVGGSSYSMNQAQAVDCLQSIDQRYVQDENVAMFRNFNSNRFMPHVQEEFVRPPPPSTSSQIVSFSANVELKNRFLGDPSHLPLVPPFEGLKTFVEPVTSDVLDAHLIASECYSDNPKVDWSLNNYHVDPYGYHIPTKELSLSLAMCQPTLSHPVLDLHSKCKFDGVADLFGREAEYATNMLENEVQHSSCVTQFSSEDKGFMKGLHSDHSTDVDCYKSLPCTQIVEFPRVLLGSEYLCMAHHILSEVFSDFTLGHQDVYAGGYLDSIDIGVSQKTASGSSGRESFPNAEEFAGTTEKAACCDEWNPSAQNSKTQTKKTDLFALLDEVDSRYTRCLDQIQMVIPSFQAATDVDPPQMNVFLALQEISNHFERLRKKIISQIASLQKCMSNQDFSEKDDCLDPASIHKQWTLQRQRRAEQLPWRPQRGLLERSVSVLRAWLFENFLHPYPKDGQKYILARQSGLTKSQVSNWFINARVRIWKPLIEEMYMEINKKVKAGKENVARRGQMEEGASAPRKH